jgi:excisionase family DNA binding protein
MSQKTPVLSKSNPLLFENKILRIDDVAKMLSLSKAHIYRLTSQKKIPFRKRGKTLFFMEHEIFDWVNQGVA